MTTTGTAPLVVVGIDGSEDSAAAALWANRYADVTGASLRLVAAWSWPDSYGYPLAIEGYDPQVDARQIAEKAATELSLPPDRVEIVTPEGSAGSALLRASADADLLVVGRHGHHALTSVLLGSVSVHCVHHAAIPVVVVR